ncbi:putative disease resistance protein (TIR-NBS-LRR class) [Trifolium medium]|uniref:Putative disease resistance protein (TIR-NBS-LRR class) n=1 Tax=Trifolium medium TaxID=97028 RepID=A0A392RA07_9FABA|nr:putative disease resistance protein (TIR-NBS-LRR class) [Trifolium medium]
MDKITECCRTTHHRLIVVPLFYDGIYPSYGTSHTSLYEDSDFVYRMLTGETEDKFMTWVAANTEDKFMTWVAANSKATTTYSGSTDILNKYG